MMRRLSALLLGLSVSSLAAQQPAAIQPPRRQRPVTGRRLAVSAARAAHAQHHSDRRPARPGPDYWQQRVDYVIRASLDTVAQTGHR